MCAAAVRLRERADQLLQRFPELRSITDHHNLWGTWTPAAEDAFYELAQIRYELEQLGATDPGNQALPVRASA